MKEIIAIIRPGKWQATKIALRNLGVFSFTTRRVYGRGRQKGLQYMGRDGVTTGMRWIPKRMLWLWLPDDQTQPVLEAVMAANRTGAIGDGKIFICPFEEALRLRTGDRGDSAL